MKLWIGFAPIVKECVSSHMIINTEKSMLEFICDAQKLGGFITKSGFYNWCHVAVVNEYLDEEDGESNEQ